MVEQFPIVLRGYDKDRVDEAFASAQETVNRLREQVKADDQTILELQAQLQCTPLLSPPQKSPLAVFSFSVCSAINSKIV